MNRPARPPATRTASAATTHRSRLHQVVDAHAARPAAATLQLPAHQPNLARYTSGEIVCMPAHAVTLSIG